MRKVLLGLLLTGMYCSGQDYDSQSGLFRSYTQTADIEDPETGLKFAVGGIDPFIVFVMGPDVIYYDVSEYDTIAWESFDSFDFGEAPESDYSGEVVVPTRIFDGTTSYVVRRLSYGTFNKCQGLTKVELALSIDCFRRKSFNECPLLEEVTVQNYPITQPRGYVFPDMFKDCPALKKVDMRFAYCVYSGIFRGCPALEEVTMYCDNNQGNAFYGRTDGHINKLTLVLPHRTETPGAFDKVGFFSHEFESTEVVVPKGTLEAFKAHPVWGRFQNLHEDGAAAVSTQEIVPEWEVIGLGDNQYRVCGEFNAGSVYELSGIKVCDLTPDNRDFTISRHGMMVVTIDGASEKIIF